MATTTGKRGRLRKSALKAGFRSGLEQDTAKYLDQRGIKFEYEKLKLSWTPPDKKYITDFHILHNGVIIETKGRFTASDRAKHLAIKAQHPGRDIRFVFSNSNQRLYKGSKTTYGAWCKRYGFLYSDKVIPEEWLK